MPPRQRRMTKGEQKKREEMDALSVREEELNEKITEEKNKRDRVSLDNEHKIGHLKQLQKQLERLTQHQHRELLGNEEKTLNLNDKLQQRMEVLQSSKEQYLVSLESYSVIERENTMLRQVVNRLREELSQSRNENAEEMASLRREMFDIRMKIELTFRKTKKSLEEEYEKKAHETMKEESDKAVVENTRLKSVLTEKRDEVMEKMGQQTSKEIAMRKSKINKDILESTVAMQEMEIENLERYQKEQEVVVSRTQGQIGILHGKLKSLQQEDKELERAVERLGVARTNYAAAKAESEKWKTQCRYMIDEVDKWVNLGCPGGMQVGYIPGIESEVGSTVGEKKSVSTISGGATVLTEGSGLEWSIAEQLEQNDGEDEDVEGIWKASKQIEVNHLMVGVGDWKQPKREELLSKTQQNELF